jgi:hypothetical protein
LGNLRARGPFSRHGNAPGASSFMCVDDGYEYGGRSGPAQPGDAACPDRTAIARPRRQLRPDAADAAFEPDGSRRQDPGRNDHRPAVGAARRQTGPLRGRVVPTSGDRSRNACACAERQQDAGDSAARQSRRRPVNPAEIAQFCRCLAGRLALLDRSSTRSLYAARSRPRHCLPPPRCRGGVAQLVRARES